MPRLSLPEPDINIYKDGFDKHKALLDRSQQGQHLSHLVETLDDPTTIAVDGAWGAGKSHFLKCWVGQHLRDNADTEVLYFDAFAHDYLDDPLVALTGALAARIEDPASKTTPKMGQKVGETIKKVAPFVGRTALRLGISLATAGIVNRADEALESILGTDEEAEGDAKNLAQAGAGSLSADAEKAIKDFWQAEAGKRAAMEAFHTALKTLTEPDESGKPTRRLVIVVDELDRCRPDYALNLLEIIKHFFPVNGVTFVLGTNLRAMQNHVIARYGAGVDAAIYLQKFVSFSMRLSDGVNGSNLVAYFDKLIAILGCVGGYAEVSKGYIKHLRGNSDITLRGLQSLARLCILTPEPQGQFNAERYKFTLITGLLYLQAMNPDVIDKMRKKNLEWKDISDHLRPYDLLSRDVYEREISEAWLLCFQDQKSPGFWINHLGDDVDIITKSYGPDTPRQLYERYVGSISLDLIS
ncbi:KAP family NTPase [Lentibacter algarum]|uniref:KAP family P-loop NTPase fold protein n=1 Tax=Lentibacter algarum TaxID=576131 RepID=UPI001C06612B|nr:P-loop NTPase fold protein [Lentibacter algarum]MBU2981779.1 KAP family NTPase [Lentibacter algarum]